MNDYLKFSARSWISRDDISPKIVALKFEDYLRKESGLLSSSESIATFTPIIESVFRQWAFDVHLPVRFWESSWLCLIGLSDSDSCAGGSGS